MREFFFAVSVCVIVYSAARAVGAGRKYGRISTAAMALWLLCLLLFLFLAATLYQTMQPDTLPGANR